MSPLEKDFHREMVSIYERANSEAGYPANYFIQMVAERGGVATARQLVLSTAPSEGFTALWQRKRLDLTVEALVLQARFYELFDEGVREAARSRLDAYGWTVPDLIE